jgi:ankyrin repeat protein
MERDMERLNDLTRLDKQTDLHVAVVHKVSEELITHLVDNMETDQLNQDDCNRRRAIDYLLDWREVNPKILESFLRRNASFDKKGDQESKWPLIRLCRRLQDGHELLEVVLQSGRYDDQRILDKLLKEAICGGSIKTVELLLKSGAKLDGEFKFLHKAAWSSQDCIPKIKLLLNPPHSLDVAMVNHLGRTLLHVSALWKPPRIDLMRMVLEYDTKGVSTNIQDKIGDTALHKVVRVHVRRTVAWKESTDAMELLLKQREIQPNIQNRHGLAPLQILMEAQSPISPNLIKLWHCAGGDFTGARISECDPKKAPLVLMSRRNDGPKLLKTLILETDLDISNCYFAMLEVAVEKGSAEMVKTLLDNRPNFRQKNWEGRLLKLAVHCERDAAEKVHCLIKERADTTYKGLDGSSLLHIAAHLPTTTEALIREVSTLYSNRESITDRKGNTPLHIAALSRHECSDKIVQDLLSAGLPLSPSDKNNNGDTPLRIVLRDSNSSADLRRKKIQFLLERGYKPTEHDFEPYEGNPDDFRSLFACDIIAESFDPVTFLVTLGRYCKMRYDGSLQSCEECHTGMYSEDKGHKEFHEVEDQISGWRDTHEWRNLSELLEGKAILITDEFAKDNKILSELITTSGVREANEAGWRKFLANNNIERMLTQMFYGQIDGSTAKERVHAADHYILDPDNIRLDPEEWITVPCVLLLCIGFFFQSLFFPFFALMIIACGQQTAHAKQELSNSLFINPRILPVVTFYSSLLGYLTFVSFLMVHVIESNTEEFIWIDWILLVYILAMVAEKVYPFRQPKRISVGSLDMFTFFNFVDILVISGLVAFLIIRSNWCSSSNLYMCQVSEYIYAVAITLAFVRVLYYLQIHYGVGPILVSFREILLQVVAFSVIMTVVLVAFAICISVVFHAGTYTTEFKDGKISLPPLFKGIWPSLQSLYWSLFGQISYTDLQSEHDILQLQATLGEIAFGIWSVVSVVVLLNMLIALLSEAFTGVRQEKAVYLWSEAMSKVLDEIKDRPSFPIPFNLLYIISELIVSMGRRNSSSDPHSIKGDSRPEATVETTVHFTAKAIKEQLANPTLPDSNEISNLKTEIEQLREHLSQQSIKNGIEDEECTVVRCKGMSYNVVQESMAYEGTNDGVGVCQLHRKPMSQQFNYFEAVVTDCGRDHKISVGLASKTHPLDKHVGHHSGSIGIHCGEGKLHVYRYVEDGKGIEEITVGTPCRVNSVIGCGLEWVLNTDPIVFFTHDKNEIWSGRVPLPEGGFFPTFGMQSEGERLELRLGVKWQPEIHVEQVFERGEMATVSPDCLFYDHKKSMLTYTGGDQVGLFQELTAMARGRTDNYFQVTLPEMKPEAKIVVGVARRSYSPQRMLGVDDGSVAFYCQRGTIVIPKYTPNDLCFSRANEGEVIGCGVTFTPGNHEVAEVFFTRNGKHFAMVSVEIPEEGFYPSIGIVSSRQVQLQINFTGQSPSTDENVNGPAYRAAETLFVKDNLVEYIGSRYAPDGACQFLNHQICPNFPYFKVTLNRIGPKSIVSIGLARPDYPLKKHPGWLKGSVAWSCDDGGLYLEDGAMPYRQYGLAKAGDVVGCGVDFAASRIENTRRRSANNKDDTEKLSVFFTLNGKSMDVEPMWITVPAGGLFPTIGMYTPGDMVQVHLSSVQTGLTSVQRLLEAKYERVYMIRDRISYASNPYGDMGRLQLTYNVDQLSSRYFEVKIINSGARNAIAIGLASSRYEYLDCLPGWTDNSIAYHCNDGLIYNEGKIEKSTHICPSLENDRIGCGVQVKDQQTTVFFTRNCEMIKKDLHVSSSPRELYPIICMHSLEEEVKIDLSACWQADDPSGGGGLFARSERVDIHDNVISYQEENEAQVEQVGAAQLRKTCHYFEVKVDRLDEEHDISLGIAPDDYPLHHHPGCSPNSAGYHWGYGCLLREARADQSTSLSLWEGDRIGCGVKFSNKGTNPIVFFTHSTGESSKSVIAEQELEWTTKGRFLPTIGMKGEGLRVAVVKNATWPNMTAHSRNGTVDYLIN